MKTNLFVLVFVLTAICGYSQNKVTINPQKVVAYPNPVSDNVTIQFKQAEGISAYVQIINDQGDVVSFSRETTDGKALLVNVSKLTKGTYFVRYIADQEAQTIKFEKA
jgi:hypothetical protein